MAKPKTIYSCTECGGQTLKWQGQCPHCSAWNTLVETVAERTTARFDADALQTRPSLQTASERKVPRSQSEVLSKNFSNPKPVQIYWFFGGR